MKKLIAMKTRITLTALLLVAVISILCACGSKKVDNTFTVDYVAMAGVVKPVIVIVGQHQNKTVKMDAGSFKDCTLISAEYLAGEGATMSGTEDGYLKVDEGMRITLKDANGTTKTVDVKEGSVFTLDTSVDGAWRILLPES